MSHPAQCRSGGTDWSSPCCLKHSVPSHHWGQVSRPDPYLAKHHDTDTHAHHPDPSHRTARKTRATSCPGALPRRASQAGQARPGLPADSRPNARVTARRKFNLNCSRIQHPSYSDLRPWPSSTVLSCGPIHNIHFLSASPVWAGHPPDEPHPHEHPHLLSRLSAHSHSHSHPHPHPLPHPHPYTHIPKSKSKPTDPHPHQPSHSDPCNLTHGVQG